MNAIFLFVFTKPKSLEKWENIVSLTDRSSSVDGDHGPKLWCGMANAKLQVFDASTWVLEQPCLQAKDRIVSGLSSVAKRFLGCSAESESACVHHPGCHLIKIRVFFCRSKFCLSGYILNFCC